jgi:hypothetical protein
MLTPYILDDLGKTLRSQLVLYFCILLGRFADTTYDMEHLPSHSVANAPFCVFVPEIMGPECLGCVNQNMQEDAGIFKL